VFDLSVKYETRHVIFLLILPLNFAENLPVDFSNVIK
jgi:hypothetical protein